MQHLPVQQELLAQPRVVHSLNIHSLLQGVDWPTASVILQVASYKLRKKRIFKMAPIHHHFELVGWSESKIIVRFWIASLVFALFALTTLKLR